MSDAHMYSQQMYVTYVYTSYLINPLVTYAHMLMYIHMYTQICVCTCICTHICAHIYISIYIYTHVDTDIYRERERERENGLFDYESPRRLGIQAVGTLPATEASDLAEVSQ